MRLKEVFENVARTIGRYRLILDGHGSHATAGFYHFCKHHQIISHYMPAHSSHHLQPLDVSCFAPLKADLWTAGPAEHAAWYKSY